MIDGKSKSYHSKDISKLKSSKKKKVNKNLKKDIKEKSYLDKK